MQIVIPSRRRAGSIAGDTLRLFPDAIVCVDESEMNDYAGCGARLLAHPPLSGLAAIVNWILGCSQIAYALQFVNWQ